MERGIWMDGIPEGEPGTMTEVVLYLIEPNSLECPNCFDCFSKDSVPKLCTCGAKIVE